MAAFAGRYARALADVLEDKKVSLETAEHQLRDYAAAWNSASDLRAIYLDPGFSLADKIKILDRMSQKIELHSLVRNFLAVLIEHHRMQAMTEILKEFSLEVGRRLGLASVSITSARALSETERSSLLEQVLELTAPAKAIPSFHLDAKLLGGVVIKIGSKMYDGSVRGRLARLEEQLTAQ